MKADTHANRERIRQLIANIYSHSEAIFVGAVEGQLAFRIRAINGKYRTGIIKLLPHQHARLNKSWLIRQVKGNIPSRGN